MHKSLLLSSQRRWLRAVGLLGVSLLPGLPTHSWATDIYTASYGGANDTNGGAPISTGTSSLGTFTVTGIYTANSTTTETVFITDGSANGQIFGTDTLFPTGLKVGQQYTATGLTNSLYDGAEEFKVSATSSLSLLSTTATVTPGFGTLSQVATKTIQNGTLTTNPFTVSPADSLYNSTNGGTQTEGSLLLAPVSFSITPTASGSLSTSTSVTLTDAATGATVTVYRSATALNYTAGQTYTLTGFEQPYQTSSEIVGATSLIASFPAPVPLYRQSTSGSWAASGGTDWASTAAGPGNTGWVNDGTYTAFFQNAPTGAITINAGNIKATGLEFDVNGYTIASDGVAGDTLTLQNAGLVTVTNANDTATVSAPINGSVGLNKNGAGTLILSGANTYTGTTTVTGGTLQVSADTALGDPTATLTLAGGTLQSGLTANGSTLAIARNITGSGGLFAATGTTLAISGTVNAGTITLPGAGTVAFTNTASPGNITGLTFQTAGGSMQATNPNNFGNLGQINLGTGGFTASQASGNVSASGIFTPSGTTVPLAVTNAAATLTVSGLFSGTTTLVKTGAGTVVINSDNSQLGGAGTGTASFRQGTVGSATNGGVVSIGAANSAPAGALGTGEFQANGGTISNDSGAAVTLSINDISLGAQYTTNTATSLVFAGASPITVTGPISLYKGATNAYQHGIIVNTPTTFSGIFTMSATATTSLGVTIAGSSTLTLNGTAANTFTEPVTIATSGTGAGVVAGKDGAFAANTSVTLNAGAKLTINTGVTTGTVNTINDAALVSINGTSGSPTSFGRIVLTIGSATETVGGLYLATGDGNLAAGFLPAGTYGSTISGATYQDNNLFGGSGVIMNLGTAVPEPSAWAAMLAGTGALLAAGFRRARRA